MPNHPKVSVETMGSFGQCSKTVASVKVADGFLFTASTSSMVGNQGRVSGKADLIHEVVQVGNQGRDTGEADLNHEVVQLQLHESIDWYIVSNRDKGEDGEVAILGSSMGSPCAMQCKLLEEMEMGVLQLMGTLFPGEVQTREVLR